MTKIKEDFNFDPELQFDVLSDKTKKEFNSKVSFFLEYALEYLDRIAESERRKQTYTYTPNDEGKLKAKQMIATCEWIIEHNDMKDKVNRNSLKMIRFDLKMREHNPKLPRKS